MKSPVFRDDRHEAFYYRMLAERRCTDSYHRALFYTLGLSKDTRAHIQVLFDFSDGGINLWNGWSQAGEERYSTPYELFDCEAAPYFFEAIRLRYPEYAHQLTPAIKPHVERTR
ncbi:hypothetical protein IDH44_07195 [Paenibacillus sp. IB182496]|uniref:Uncharacterized protein n=1 Tax=Paenibacillus sabuli TaxID=2772509 RepID=A0A927BSI8_9BACL|nr:DUF6075 family protein [Paenibacillus sabuli]MBD2844970.1 hypothetical protein [Paenibacillus sabuli]